VPATTWYRTSRPGWCDRAHFDEVVARLVAAGVDDVFVPAGDADPPAGEFTSALDLLERLT